VPIIKPAQEHKYSTKTIQIHKNATPSNIIIIIIIIILKTLSGKNQTTKRNIKTLRRNLVADEREKRKTRRNQHDVHSTPNKYD